MRHHERSPSLEGQFWRPDGAPSPVQILDGDGQVIEVRQVQPDTATRSEDPIRASLRWLLGEQWRRLSAREREFVRDLEGQLKERGRLSQRQRACIAVLVDRLSK
jgi:hypothetical protein